MRARAVLIGLGVVAMSAAALAPSLLSNHVKVPEKSVQLPSKGILKAFAPLNASRYVPQNILDSIYVPSDSVVVTRVNNDGHQGGFDRTVDFRSTRSSSTLDKYFPQELADHGWKIISSSKPYSGTGTEVLATRPSSAYYWETGVIVRPSATTGATSFSVEILQQQDP